MRRRIKRRQVKIKENEDELQKARLNHKNKRKNAGRGGRIQGEKRN